MYGRRCTFWGWRSGNVASGILVCGSVLKFPAAVMFTPVNLGHFGIASLGRWQLEQVGAFEACAAQERREVRAARLAAVFLEGVGRCCSLQGCWVNAWHDAGYLAYARQGNGYMLNACAGGAASPPRLLVITACASNCHLVRLGHRCYLWVVRSTAVAAGVSVPGAEHHQRLCSWRSRIGSSLPAVHGGAELLPLMPTACVHGALLVGCPSHG
jgi:hypothetical protein